MKIFISIDMEGIAGTFSWEADSNSSLMIQQLEWVIEGIKDSNTNKNIDEIVIADSHSGGNNIPYSFTSIDYRVHLISGWTRPQYTMTTLDKSFNVVFFVGYHAGSGFRGVMDHTYSGSIHKLWINDIEMNELLISSAYAGYCDVPIGLIIGDSGLKEELQKTNAISGYEYVVTKEVLGRVSAKLKPIEKVKNETIKAIKKVLESDISKINPLKLKTPITLRIELAKTSMADMVSLMPLVNRVGDRVIELVNDDYKVIFNAIIPIIVLSDVNF